MGLIKSQSIRGTVFNYMGVCLGFVTTSILFTRFLSIGQIGLINTLIAYALLISQLGTLGFNNITNRLFPHFRNEHNSHNNFSAILLLLSGFSSLIFLIIFPFLAELLTEEKESTGLLHTHIIYLIPFTLSYLIFSIFDNYTKAVLFNATLGIFLREFVQRLLILIAVILYALQFFSYTWFLTLYSISLWIPPISVLTYLLIHNQLKIKPNINFIKQSKIGKEMAVVSLFGIIGGLSGMVIVTIDKIMITNFIGLDQTGIYSTCFFFGTLVLIPSRSMLKISITFISEAWKRNDLAQIYEVYKKSCVSQLIIALFFFFIIWLNLDSIFIILTKNFESGRYVILFIAFANVLVMSTGVNGIIISTSKYFRFESYLIIIFGLFVILTNWVFIPKYKINGAGFASLISTLLYAIIRVIFVYRKFGFQPYSWKFVLILLIGAICFFLCKIIPANSSFIIDIAIRSTLFTLLYVPAIYYTKASGDINGVLEKYLKKITRSTTGSD